MPRQTRNAFRTLVRKVEEVAGIQEPLGVENTRYHPIFHSLYLAVSAVQFRIHGCSDGVHHMLQSVRHSWGNRLCACVMSAVTMPRVNPELAIFPEKLFSKWIV